MTRARLRRTIVFDLDGTLVDSLPLVLAAIQHAIEPHGGEATMDIFAHLGGPPESFMGKLVKDPLRVPEALRRMYAFHHGNAHLIRPYAGARSLLERLAARGVQAAIWTGRDRESTDTLLREHGLGDLLAVVVCGDDLSSHKPDPAGLRAILNRLGCAAAEALFVGDADVDVLGGHACGVDTILIRHERAVGSDILARAWRVVATPVEAYDCVLRWVDPVD
jgi:HAD superfamily hydrolase (TIGR01509 family)